MASSARYNLSRTDSLTLSYVRTGSMSIYTWIGLFDLNQQPPFAEVLTAEVLMAVRTLLTA